MNGNDELSWKVKEMFPKYLPSIKLRKSRLKKDEKLWVYTQRLYGLAQAYPVIGMDGCAITALSDKYRNTIHRFYALVEAKTVDEAKLIGKRSFIAATGAFAYMNAIGYSPAPDSSNHENDYVEEIDDFMGSEDEVDHKGEALQFLLREIDPSKTNRHYESLVFVYQRIMTGDLYMLQAAKYLSRAFSLSSHSPSEAIVLFFKQLEIQNRKQAGAQTLADKSPKFTDENVKKIVLASGLHMDILPSLITFRDLRNNLLAHGVIEPEVQMLDGSYVPTKQWEKDMIRSFGSIKEGLINYEITAETLGRKLFSELLGIPYFRLIYPGCGSQLEDKHLLNSDALEPKEDDMMWGIGIF